MTTSTKCYDPPLLTAKDHQQYRKNLAKKGIVKNPHAPFTTNYITYLKYGSRSQTPHEPGGSSNRGSLGSRFCAFMNEDHLHFLRNSSLEDIMTFVALHKNSRIKKLSSSQEYKRIYLMLY